MNDGRCLKCDTYVSWDLYAADDESYRVCESCLDIEAHKDTEPDSDRIWDEMIMRRKAVKEQVLEEQLFQQLEESIKDEEPSAV